MAARFETIQLGQDDDGRRFDRIARRVLSHVPLSKIYSAIRSGDIRLNGRRARGDDRVAAGDVIAVRPALAGPRRTVADLQPYPRDFEDRIVFESRHLLVVRKTRGELVHGKGSLNEVVARYLRSKTEESVSFRPGPVHRLDRNTTGLVIFAASLRGAQRMSEAFREGRLKKVYGAVLQGAVESPQIWNTRISRDPETLRSHVGTGQPAETMVEPLSVRDSLTLATMLIPTGRTHQIRAHAADAGTPLIGDRKYGGAPFPGGYILHAGSVACPPLEEDIPGFDHLWAPLPEEAEARVRGLFGADALSRLYNRFSGAGESVSVY